MNVVLWVAAGLLATVALISGLIKTCVAQEKLATVQGGGWTEDAKAGFVKSLGILELLAAVGLILPAAVDIAPTLVPVTALCWVGLMIGAMITHGRRGEFSFAMLNVLYLAIAAFIAWGRLGPNQFH
jgi:hypothetical protein